MFPNILISIYVNLNDLGQKHMSRCKYKQMFTGTLRVQGSYKAVHSAQGPVFCVQEKFYLPESVDRVPGNTSC